MLVELLRPLGPELARRWLAALAIVDADEREAMVSMVERQVAELYGAGRADQRDRARAAEPSERNAQGRDPQSIQVVHPPVQRDGHVEQIVTTYEVVEAADHEPDHGRNGADIREVKPVIRQRRAR